MGQIVLFRNNYLKIPFSEPNRIHILASGNQSCNYANIELSGILKLQEKPRIKDYLIYLLSKH